jgi:triosephosphate isomerase
MPRQLWVGGNWKCNGTKDSEKALVENLNNAVKTFPPKNVVDVVVSPPSIWLTNVLATIDSRIIVSSQDVNFQGSGAFTGTLSSQILLSAGINTTLVGHSERRDLFHETDEEIGSKVASAQKAGLTVIACLGEHLTERDAGKTNEVLFRQVKFIADNVSDWNRLVIAYEPVWAIGTGRVATPEQVFIIFFLFASYVIIRRKKPMSHYAVGLRVYFFFFFCFNF